MAGSDRSTATKSTSGGAGEGSSRRGTLRDQQREFTRSRLIDAALELFGEVGYAEATIDGIVNAAGASRATFYLHFGRKADVLDAIGAELEPGVDAYWEELDGITAEPSRKKIRSWIDRAFEWLDEHEAVVRASQERSIIDGEVAPHRFSSLPDVMPRYLATWPAAEQSAARLRVQLLAVLLDSFYRHWRIEQVFEVDADLAKDVFVDIWMRTLRLTPEG